MRKPTDSSELLNDLTRLHQQLSSSTQVTDPVPVLDDIVRPHEPAPEPEPLSLEQELMIHATEKILPEIIAEFTPLITQELSRRLQKQLRSTFKQRMHAARKYTPR